MFILQERNKMAKKKVEKIDYVFVSNKKVTVPESSRKVIRSEYRGTTLVERIIDKHFEELLIGGRYGIGIE